MLAEVSRGRRRPTSTGRSRPPARAYDTRVVEAAGARARQVPVPHRPHPAGARPRAGRARVARQRQADPRVARRRRARWSPRTSSTTPAGPTSSSTPGFGAGPAAARRRRPGHPVELPAAHAGLEDRAGAGLRQHRRAQAGRDHAADRAAVRRDLPAGRPAARRRQHRHRRRRHRPGAGRAPGRRQGRVHRLDRGRQDDRPSPSRAPARRSRSSSAARPPTSSSTTRRSTRRSRASSTASSSTRATCAAPARGCSCRSASPTRCSSRSSAGCRRCGSATRWTRTPTSAPSTRASSWTRIRELSDDRRGRGRRALVAAVRAAGQGLLVPADRLHRRHPGAPHRPRGDLRPGAVGADVPHARTRRSRRPTTRRTACPPGCGPRRARASSGWPTSCAPAWSGPTRSTASTRRRPFGGYKESGYGREGGRHGLEAYLDGWTLIAGSTSARPTSCTSAARSRGPERPLLRGDRPQGPLPRQRRAGLPQGRPRRRRGGPQGVPRLVGGDGVQPRPGALPRRRAARGPARPVRRRGRRRRGPDDRARPRPRVDAAIDRWVWYAGWSDKIAQVARLDQPGRRPVLRLLRARADRRGRRPRPAGLVAARAGVACSRRSIVTGNTAVVLASEERPLPAVTLSEVLATSDVPGGVVNVLTGRTAEVAPWLASHMDVNAIDLAGAPAELVTELRGRRRRQPQAGRAPRRRARLGRARRARSGCSPSWRPRRSGTPSASDRMGQDGLVARVVLLAGPSGSGKTHLAEESGLPMLDLDDFYKDGDDPTLPRHPTLGIVDWDDPASWDAAAALAALEQICRDGAARGAGLRHRARRPGRHPALRPARGTGFRRHRHLRRRAGGRRPGARPARRRRRGPPVPGQELPAPPAPRPRRAPQAADDAGPPRPHAAARRADGGAPPGRPGLPTVRPRRHHRSPPRGRALAGRPRP